ncbi:ABC transporter permease [Phytomonospora endophytica]|uniref:ABC-2 type transport system permease protein n=1 Tax=Phytomonospora endophytica TaxID=714109 RepID=A0A841FLV0_9ACTN|nr:ABC-2 family transporter protein [Phytomonospora endophytica]MBB6034778.1 ABC-2 type transport system permease protein [Phytomonospora endophytica]
MGAALARAGFRRYSTYRQATLAGLSTNIVFGMLRMYVLVAAGAAAGGVMAGYTVPQLGTYIWVGQGLLATILMWGWTELSDRVRSGDVVADLLRPVNPVWTYLATDLGRAGHAALIRLLVPVLFGALFFPFYWPREPLSYPLFGVSLVLAVLLCFACRYLVNLTAFWLLDIRGVVSLWMAAAGVLSGLYFPLAFLPGWLAAILQYGTPFPSLMQFPTDVAVERGGLAGQLERIGVQVAWTAVMYAVVFYVQRRAMRKLVIQGG